MDNHTIAPSVPTERNETPQYAATQSLGKDPQEMSVESYFQLHHPNTKDTETMKDLIRVVGAEHQTDLLFTLQQLEARAGNPPLGVSRLQHLYNYAKLNAQMQSLGRQLEQYGS